MSIVKLRLKCHHIRIRLGSKFEKKKKPYTEKVKTYTCTI